VCELASIDVPTLLSGFARAAADPDCGACRASGPCGMASSMPYRPTARTGHSGGVSGGGAWLVGPTVRDLGPHRAVTVVTSRAGPSRQVAVQAGVDVVALQVVALHQRVDALLDVLGLRDAKEGPGCDGAMRV
jgi:hypothetical protein